MFKDYFVSSLGFRFPSKEVQSKYYTLNTYFLCLVILPIWHIHKLSVSVCFWIQPTFSLLIQFLKYLRHIHVKNQVKYIKCILRAVSSTSVFSIQFPPLPFLQVTIFLLIYHLSFHQFFLKMQAYIYIKKKIV